MVPFSLWSTAKLLLPNSRLLCCCWLYIAAEVCFYLAFRFVWIPRANEVQPVAPYRDYPAVRDRHKLLLRIIDRLKQRAAASQQQEEDRDDDLEAKERRVITTFLLEWFAPIGKDDVDKNAVQHRRGGLEVQQEPWRAAGEAAAAIAATEKAAALHSAQEHFEHQTKSSQSPPPPPLREMTDVSSYTSSSSVSSSSRGSSRSRSNSRSRNGEDEDDEQMSSNPDKRGRGTEGRGKAATKNEPIETVQQPRRTRQIDAVSSRSSLRSSHTTKQEQQQRQQQVTQQQQQQRRQEWTIPGLTKRSADSFFAWAFFGKDAAALNRDERDELERLFAVIRREVGLVFDTTAAPALYRPRRLSLEPVNPLFRPLAVYAAIWFIKYVLAAAVLRSFGFVKCTVSCDDTDVNGGSRGGSNQQLVAWVRKRRRASSEGADDDEIMPPLLFFHGIAPAGLAFYLPMLFFGLGLTTTTRNRTVILFENPNISSEITFSALSEEETVRGVERIVDRYVEQGRGGPLLTVVGHSFGSCPCTWLVRSPSFRHRIKRFVLLDPVTVLLSEPDVMVNFLYSKSVDKIRMVASSELFTEYYLRRHFAWYNAELWLDDIPASTAQTTLFLAERDEIVRAPAVRAYVEQYRQQEQQQRQRQQQTTTTARPPPRPPTISCLYWKGAGHAACVTSPNMWKQIRQHIDDDNNNNWQQQRDVFATTSPLVPQNRQKRNETYCANNNDDSKKEQ